MKQRNYQYQIPEADDLELGVSLSARLKRIWDEARENSFEIYLYAAALRNRYLDIETKQYSEKFKEWYAKQELEMIFGKLPSFTKYASAGDVVNYCGQKFKNGKYIKHLPLSRSALYEIALLKDGITETQLEKLFHSGGEDNDPLIHPSATAAEISAYRERGNAKSSPTSKARKSQFNIQLATIYVSKDLYKFHRTTGEHVGSVDLTDTEKTLTRLRASLDGKLFDVRDNLKKITKAYVKREKKNSPSAPLREKEDPRKKRR